MNKSSQVQPTPDINAAILTIRDQKVLLDADLALIYSVPTKALNQAVKRNLGRFPADFVFQLTTEETVCLNRSQFVTASIWSQIVTTSKCNIWYRPLHAQFTESTKLEQAIKANLGGLEYA
jgi:hypothetical protein